MTANKLRGEVVIELGGKEHILRPTFDALIKIEQETGRSLVELARAMTVGEVRLSQYAAIVEHGITAGGSKIEKGFKEDLTAIGISKLTIICLEFIANAISGEGGDEKKADQTASQ